MDEKLKHIPGIAHQAMVNGYSFTSQGSNTGMSFLPLKPWDKRGSDETIDDITEKINKAAADISGASVLVYMKEN